MFREDGAIADLAGVYATTQIVSSPFMNDSELEELLNERGKAVQKWYAEQIELFWSNGQCIVLGDHKSSGGNHVCTAARSARPTITSVARLLLAILRSGRKRSRLRSVEDWIDRICLICGRIADCRFTQWVAVAVSPRFQLEAAGDEAGAEDDRNGVTWAFLQEQETLLDAASFKIHEERPKPTLPPPNGPVAALVRQIPDTETRKGGPLAPTLEDLRRCCRPWFR